MNFGWCKQILFGEGICLNTLVCLFLFRKLKEHIQIYVIISSAKLLFTYMTYLETTIIIISNKVLKFKFPTSQPVLKYDLIEQKAETTTLLFRHQREAV